VKTWVTISILASLPIILRAWKHLGRLGVDPSDTSHFAGAFRSRHIYTFTGFVGDINKAHDSVVTGEITSTLGELGQVQSVRGRTSTEVIVDDQFILTQPNGSAQSFQLQGFNIAIGTAHVVSVASTVRKRGKHALHFMVYDHNTGQPFFSKAVLRKLIWPYPVPYIAVLGLMLLPLPFLVVLGFLAEYRVGRFQRSGAAPLIAALNASAATLPRQPELNIDELDRLARLVREGLVTDDEWTRAKGLFLGKAPDDRTLTLDQLDRLYSLNKSGALSDSEYNNKKWEILSRRS
jgi:hypothetical protein